jgi:hypothetical protein
MTQEQKIQPRGKTAMAQKTQYDASLLTESIITMYECFACKILQPFFERGSTRETTFGPE